MFTLENRKQGAQHAKKTRGLLGISVQLKLPGAERL